MSEPFVPMPAVDRPFAAPWEAQAFAMVLKLHEAGLFQWSEFADRLSTEIHAHPDAPYYECWYEAAVQLLTERGIVAKEALFEQARKVVRFRASDHHHIARTEPIAVSPARSTTSG